MRQSSTVAEYLDELTRQLSFDARLAHRVRQEVEDHLWEAANGAGDASLAAQHRATANFGDPRVIAAQYAALSLWVQTRRTGVTVILAVARTAAVSEGPV